MQYIEIKCVDPNGWQIGMVLPHKTFCKVARLTEGPVLWGAHGQSYFLIVDILFLLLLLLLLIIIIIFLLLLLLGRKLPKQARV
jgi:hypothetical protein